LALKKSFYADVITIASRSFPNQYSVIFLPVQVSWFNDFFFPAITITDGDEVIE